ncbi:MAG TPA: hypothetical protein ENO22_06030 [candidate division Zixibacteria bacterium]|nr:hypothetical protein [candidate division Zixibacteria bacterium]
MDCVKVVLQKAEKGFHVVTPSGEGDKAECCIEKPDTSGCVEIKVICGQKQEDEGEEKECCS